MAAAAQVNGETKAKDRPAIATRHGFIFIVSSFVFIVHFRYSFLIFIGIEPNIVTVMVELKFLPRFRFNTRDIYKRSTLTTLSISLGLFLMLSK